MSGTGDQVSRGDPLALASYTSSIRSARTSIHIQNAYFLPSRQIREELIKAARRGVDVRVMVPGRHIDQPLVRMASRLHYGELLTGGVRILEYNRTMMHQKGAVIDGVFILIGSINFASRSIRENAEASFAFYDRESPRSSRRRSPLTKKLPRGSTRAGSARPRAAPCRGARPSSSHY